MSEYDIVDELDREIDDEEALYDAIERFEEEERITDNEIIKALECHKARELETCSKCPLLNIEWCAYELSQYALDLINRKDAEIERLEETITLQAETLETHNKKWKTARNDGIKLFADVLKAKRGTRGEIWDTDIDNLVKEMVGENNG